LGSPAIAIFATPISVHNTMEIIRSAKEAGKYTNSLKKSGRSIGFVPTMGALHKGHLRLIDQCLSMSDLCTCSIFVNPLQFNNPEDFRLYPSTFDIDAELLRQRGCDMLFYPAASEMYPKEVQEKYDFGILDQVMEGKYRPGHFNGVAIAVRRLFEIIGPDQAFFGEKDYQQLQVVKKLMSLCSLKVEIIGCETVREPDGLAMSSRNLRLGPEARKSASGIYCILKTAIDRSTGLEVSDLKEWVCQRFKETAGITLEYFELSDALTLEPLIRWTRNQEVVACVAVFIEGVRLIDNVRFIRNFAS
jgi:pantoate--beta-alanine ligase